MLSGSGGIGGGNSVSWNKPAALVCHICGREYGTTSLKIHLPQCEKMWIARESLKDRKDRRPVPKPSAMNPMSVNFKDAASMAAYNEAATKQFNDKALVACENCGRTFFEDRLAIHLRSCRPGNEAARVGTGRIKSASEAVAAATPLKAKLASPAGKGSSNGGVLSPPSAGGLKKIPSPSSGGSSAGPSSSRPRTSGGGSSIPPTSARAKVAPTKSTGNWEDDLNSELDEQQQQQSRAPPSKGYSLPPEASGDYGEDGGETAPCSLCGRHFNVDRLSKHEAVCRKQQASNAKRAAKIAAKQSKLPQPGTQKSANTDAWKAKHNEFQNAIQYAKKLTAMQKAGVSLSNLPPPPRSENPDYVQCPHCSRRFNQQAAERHIPSCANTINKPRSVASLQRAKAPAAGSMAAQRAKAAGAISPPGRGAPQGGYGGGGGFGGGASSSAAAAGGYGDYDAYGARPGSSGGMQPRAAAPRGVASVPSRAAAAPPAGVRPAPAGRAASSIRSPPPAAAGGGATAVLGAFCSNCGAKNPLAAAKFCASCGASAAGR